MISFTYAVDEVENEPGLSSFALRSAKCLANADRRVAVEKRRRADGCVGVGGIEIGGCIGVAGIEACFSSSIGTTSTAGRGFCSLLPPGLPMLLSNHEESRIGKISSYKAQLYTDGMKEAECCARQLRRASLDGLSTYYYRVVVTEDRKDCHNPLEALEGHCHGGASDELLSETCQHCFLVRRRKEGSKMRSKRRRWIYRRLLDKHLPTRFKLSVAFPNMAGAAEYIFG